MFNFNKIALDVLAEDAGAAPAMQRRTAQEPRLAEEDGSADGGVSLLAKVDFKWLMAGQGWWIDPKRFQCDPSYADGWLNIARASPSFALRARAASIQNQIGRRASC
ncbi:MAG: hypothetical protein ABIQ90_17730 [Polaromonas sp.]